jgi:dihydroorotate dehydrogenase electron transfer subunit
MNQPHIVKIKTVKIENTSVKTIIFPYSKKTKPGQFFMIWIPGVDEIPMSVSMIQDEVKSITFKKIGDATTALFNLKENELIGIRGPYGNGFSFNRSDHLFIGGGTGIAMIASAVEACLNKSDSVNVIIGAKSKKELFFVKRLMNTKANVFIATDDGSEGFKGYASDLALKIIEEQSIKSVYTCGPELMMKSILNICNKKNISLQASLERYMKCAVGICGQCCISNGIRVCVEGPIFSHKELNKINDFGRFMRKPSGMKKNIKN